MANFRLWASGAMVAKASDHGRAQGAVSFRPPRKVAESAGSRLPDEAALLLHAFEESQQGWLWSTDADGCVTYISGSIERKLKGQSHLLGQSLADHFVLADADFSVRRTLSFLLVKQTSFERVNVCSVVAENEHFWALSGSPIHDKQGRFIGFRGSAIDVTAHRLSSNNASQLAKYDPLTGLPNRRRMAEVLDARLLTAQQQRQSCAILLIDLDRFKQVNDTLGHPAGDALLKQVAERLSRITGDVERVFRLGGDEFQVILPSVDERGAVGDLAAEMIDQLSQPYMVNGSRCTIGASVGIALFPDDGTTRSALIRNADLALYASKSGGRGGFRFFATEFLEAAENKRTLEEDLRDALDNGEIHLEYQPIVSTKTNCVVGVEALIRWDHPVRGPISPAVFIPIAEEAGVIETLGEWALHQACDDAARWPGKLRVAVNVSPLQFSNERLPGIVAAALDASGLAPERLELEITEGVFLSQSTATGSMFATLKSLGVRLALDDFGTGYSSLSYLRTAPFDKIKIDQTFVRAATMPGSRDAAIIAAIVALAQAIGMETTAEGIEFMEQLDLIRSLGVSHVQGWVYSKAIPTDELSGQLAAGEWAIEPFGPERQRSARQSTYRKVGVIHANYYRSFILRNLSESGALIAGDHLIAVGTRILVDFGDGQLSWANVTRSSARQCGIAFEQDLLADGMGGFQTSNRVSSYLLKSAGLPSPGDSDRRLDAGDVVPALEELAEKLGVPTAPPKLREFAVERLATPFLDSGEPSPTISTIATAYLETIKCAAARDAARRDIHGHIGLRFGQLRVDQVSKADVADWLVATSEGSVSAQEKNRRLQELFGHILDFAEMMRSRGMTLNPAEGSLRVDRRGNGGALLDARAASRLLEAACQSQNRQLRFIIALLMLTGARQWEVLSARWDDLDLEHGSWRLSAPGRNEARDLRLNQATLRLLTKLYEVSRSSYVVPNPITRKPYRSFAAAWQAVRSKADLAYLEVDDLRYCDLGVTVWDDILLSLILDADGAQNGERPDIDPSGQVGTVAAVSPT